MNTESRLPPREMPEPIGPPQEDYLSRIMGGVAAIALALFFGLVLFSSRGDDDAQGARHPAVGKPLTGLHLVPLGREGEPKKLATLTGYVTLVNYWGPWCGFCKVEMPHLLKLKEKLREQADFQLLLVSCAGRAQYDAAEHTKETLDYLRKLDAEVLPWEDPQLASQHALIRSAGLDRFGYPTTVLLDREGKIRGLWEGYGGGEEKEMEELARAVLAEKK